MKALLLLLALTALASARVSFEGQQVWRMNVAVDQHVAAREVVDVLQLDVWGAGSDWLDVLIRPDQMTLAHEKLAQRGIQSRVHIEDLQPLVDRTYQDMATNGRAAFDFEKYNTFEDIEAYLAGLPAQDDRTSLVSLGQTLHGRDLWQLKISTGGGEKQPIWIDCGIHAREWISPATCLWGINFLLSSYGTNADVTQLLDTFDFLILPVNNPDGYTYTQTDRFWRKNRNHYEGSACTGVDLNRNFDDHFGGLGTSANPCSDSFKGPEANSELETQAVSAAIKSIAGTAKSLYSLHSYSQLWMYAYGWTYEHTEHEQELNKVAKTGVDALTAVHGTVFEYGDIASTIYPAAGTTVDYAYTQGIIYSYTIELRDTGNFGFLLPADQIKPSGEETWAGLVAALLATP